MMEQHRRDRPRFFDLAQLQWPVGAVTSFGHRLSGVLLALATPFYLYLLDLSLQNERGYSLAAGFFSRWPAKVFAVVSIWSLSHHLLAGLRHLLSDVDIGAALAPARRSAWAVNCAAAAIALLCAGALA